MTIRISIVKQTTFKLNVAMNNCEEITNFLNQSCHCLRTEDFN